MQSSISKYRITKRVGGGSFGDIYLGVGANGEKVGCCRVFGSLCFLDEFPGTGLRDFYTEIETA